MLTESQKVLSAILLFRITELCQKINHLKSLNHSQYKLEIEEARNQLEYNLDIEEKLNAKYRVLH